MHAAGKVYLELGSGVTAVENCWNVAPGTTEFYLDYGRVGFALAEGPQDNHNGGLPEVKSARKPMPAGCISLWRRHASVRLCKWQLGSL